MVECDRFRDNEIRVWPLRHLLSIINPSSPSDLLLQRQFSCSMGTFGKQSIARGAVMVAKNWMAKFNALRPLQETEGWTTPQQWSLPAPLYSLHCQADLPSRYGHLLTWGAAFKYPASSNSPVFIWKFAPPLLSLSVVLGREFPSTLLGSSGWSEN